MTNDEHLGMDLLEYKAKLAELDAIAEKRRQAQIELESIRKWIEERNLDSGDGAYGVSRFVQTDWMKEQDIAAKLTAEDQLEIEFIKLEGLP